MTSVYKSPGVHVESAGDRFISLDAVETGVTAFLGVTPNGPRQSPVRVGSFEQYERVFGGREDFMSAGVRGFFAASTRRRTTSSASRAPNGEGCARSSASRRST